MTELLLHLIGDYLLQSDWMASGKTKNWRPALAHAVAYSLPFLLIATPAAVAVILLTHYLIDRYRLARFVVYAKNFIAPKSAYRSWSDCSSTGYPNELPPFMAVWLLIIADNTIHMVINHFAIACL